MTQLAVYLISMALVVLGAMAFIWALSIPGRFRMVLACLAACVPVAAGGWIFRASGLKVNDFGRLLKTATEEIRQMTKGLKETQSNRQSLEELMGPVREAGRQQR